MASTSAWPSANRKEKNVSRRSCRPPRLPNTVMAARWSGPSPCSTPKKKMTMSRAMRKFQTGDSNTLKNSEFFAHQQSVKGIEIIARKDLQSGVSVFLVKFHCGKIIYRRLQRYITTAGFFQLFFRSSQ